MGSPSEIEIEQGAAQPNGGKTWAALANSQLHFY
jgi:hypothetical protein